MPNPTNKVDDPCEECRNRHLKCDDHRPRCSQCERTGQKCCRTKGQRRFRDGSSAQYEKQFAKDQVWLGFTKNAKIQIVDQSAELENFYSIEEPSPIQVSEKPSSERRLPESTDSTRSLAAPLRREIASKSPEQPNVTRAEQVSPRSLGNTSPTSLENILSSPNTSAKRRKTDDSVVPSDARYVRSQAPSGSQDFSTAFVNLNSPSSLSYHNPYYVNNFASPTEVNETKKIEAEYARIADRDAGAIPAEPLLSASSWKKSFRWPNQFTTQQCMCLMKYYIETLGPWFDIGDTQRHFTSIVPHRARRSPPLLNAIFSAAAIHLRYVSHLRSPGTSIQYGGFDLPMLDKVSEIKYYQATTAYLRALCVENKHAQDEDLLAATVIIRFYEDFEELIKEGMERDRTLNVRPFQLFVTAQAKPDLGLDTAYDQYDFRIRGCFKSIRHLAEPYLKSYQHSSFRIALRQECQRALSNKEEIKLPLEEWKLLEGFDEAEDSVWSDRHLYHYANVLQFCFSDQGLTNTRMQRWQELKDFETRWDEERPLSFSHFMKIDADRERGTVFPQIWYVSEVNAAGMIYFHFARILLTIYNPNFNRPGIGSAARQRKLSEEVREIVIQLCGIGMSASPTHPVLVQAHSAIYTFGEHFFDQRDQQALLSVLEEIESTHGWPVSDEVGMLKKEWGW